MHSKALYLRIGDRSVVWLGSHNWTRNALSLTGPRNAEASVRIELPFDPAQLAGTSGCIAGEVNRHLLHLWNEAPTEPLDDWNADRLESFRDAKCASEGKSSSVLLFAAAESDSEGLARSGAAWLKVRASGLLLASSDARVVRDLRRSDKVLLMVWPSRGDVGRVSPYLIRAHASDLNEPGGPNRAVAPIQGFVGRLDDRAWTATLPSGDSCGLLSLSLHTSAPGAVSRAADGSDADTTWFLLAVEAVWRPAGLDTGGLSPWVPETLPLETRRQKAPRTWEVAEPLDSIRRIRTFWEEEFGLNATNARGLPVPLEREKRGDLHGVYVDPVRAELLSNAPGVALARPVAGSGRRLPPIVRVYHDRFEHLARSWAQLASTLERPP